MLVVETEVVEIFLFLIQHVGGVHLHLLEDVDLVADGLQAHVLRLQDLVEELLHDGVCVVFAVGIDQKIDGFPGADLGHDVLEEDVGLVHESLFLRVVLKDVMEHEDGFVFFCNCANLSHVHNVFLVLSVHPDGLDFNREELFVIALLKHKAEKTSEFVDVDHCWKNQYDVSCLLQRLQNQVFDVRKQMREYIEFLRSVDLHKQRLQNNHVQFLEISRQILPLNNLMREIFLGHLSAFEFHQIDALVPEKQTIVRDCTHSIQHRELIDTSLTYVINHLFLQVLLLKLNY